MFFRPAQADRRPKAFALIEISLPRRSAPRVGLRRREGCLLGRRRPTIGQRPPQAEFIRRPGRPSAEGFRADWKSASPGADAPSVGPFAPIEIGLPRRWRARRRPSPTQKCLLGRRRPTIGQRPPQAEFIRRPGRPSAEGFRADWKSASPGADAPSVGPFAPIEIGLPRRWRARRRPSPTQKCLLGRRRPTIGQRPPQAEFIRRPGRPSLSRRLKSASPGAPRRASASADATVSVGAGRPSAEGPPRSNSFDAQGWLLAKGFRTAKSTFQETSRRA